MHSLDQQRITEFSTTFLYRNSPHTTLEWYNQDPKRDEWFFGLPERVQEAILTNAVAHGALDMLQHWSRVRPDWIRQEHLQQTIKQNTIAKKILRPVGIQALHYIGIKEGIDDLLMLSGKFIAETPYRDQMKKHNGNNKSRKQDRFFEQYAMYKIQQDVLALAHLQQAHPEQLNPYTLVKMIFPYAHHRPSKISIPRHVIEYLPYHPEGFFVHALVLEMLSTIRNGKYPQIHQLDEWLQSYDFARPKGLGETLHHRLLKITSTTQTQYNRFQQDALEYIRQHQCTQTLPPHSYTNEYSRLHMIGLDRTPYELLHVVHEQKKANVSFATDDNPLEWDFV